MRALWIVVLLSGCRLDLADDDPNDPMIQVTFDINGNQLDEVELVQSPSEYDYWRDAKQRTTGPLTPGLIAQGITAQPIADLWSMDPETDYGIMARFDNPNPDWAYQTEKNYARRAPILFMAIGRRMNESGALVAVAAGRAVVTNEQLNLGETTQVKITLESVDIEEWGYRACKRYHKGDTTTYLIWNSDFDCDHIFTANDCRPDDYCDPMATSGPLADNCACP